MYCQTYTCSNRGNMSILLVVYIVIGLLFAAIQDYNESEPEAHNILKGLFVGLFWPIIAIVFFVDDKELLDKKEIK